MDHEISAEARITADVMAVRHILQALVAKTFVADPLVSQHMEELRTLAIALIKVNNVAEPGPTKDAIDLQTEHYINDFFDRMRLGSR
jgi:hypothetical protein